MRLALNLSFLSLLLGNILAYASETSSSGSTSCTLKTVIVTETVYSTQGNPTDTGGNQPSSVESNKPSGSSGNATPSGSSGNAAPTNTGLPENLKLKDPIVGCECGYNVTSLNVYFPYHYSLFFNSLNALGKVNWDDSQWLRNDGQLVQQTTKDGVGCKGKKDNVYIDGSDLVLKVPKDQKVSAEMDCAEIVYKEKKITGGIFETTAKLNGVLGTAQTFRLNHSTTTGQDEVDLMVYSSEIDKIGMRNNNYHVRYLLIDQRQVAFPDVKENDPREMYSNYTIVWLDDTTARYLNGVKQDSPTDYHLQKGESMAFGINHWTDGDKGQTVGPPKDKDALLRVLHVLMYYKTEDVSKMSDLSNNCQQKDICQV
nr:hypothetical protein L204_00338 [Cryptococcus depauperatus CBS 7855]